MRKIPSRLRVFCVLLRRWFNICANSGVCRLGERLTRHHPSSVHPSATAEWPWIEVFTAKSRNTRQKKHEDAELNPSLYVTRVTRILILLSGVLCCLRFWSICVEKRRRNKKISPRVYNARSTAETTDPRWITAEKAPTQKAIKISPSKKKRNERGVEKCRVFGVLFRI